MSSEKLKCKHCDGEIFFHEKWVSKKTGKKVPVEEYKTETGESKWRQHQCPNKPSWETRIKTLEERLAKLENGQ